MCVCVSAVKRSLKAMSLNENPPALFILSAAISDAEGDVSPGETQNGSTYLKQGRAHTHINLRARLPAK